MTVKFKGTEVRPGDKLRDRDGDWADVVLRPENESGLGTRYHNTNFGEDELADWDLWHDLETPWWVEHLAIGPVMEAMEDPGDSVIMGEATFTPKVTPGSSARKAAEILDGRNDKYDNNSQRVQQITAQFWNVYTRNNMEEMILNAADVDRLMALHKMARMIVDPEDQDHYDDAIGYLSLARHAMEEEL